MSFGKEFRLELYSTISSELSLNVLRKHKSWHRLPFKRTQILIDSHSEISATKFMSGCSHSHSNFYYLPKILLAPSELVVKKYGQCFVVYLYYVAVVNCCSLAGTLRQTFHWTLRDESTNRNAKERRNKNNDCKSRITCYQINLHFRKTHKPIWRSNVDRAEFVTLIYRL